MRKCIRVRIAGKVCGVSYREFVQKHAQKLGIEGTVQNMSDGSVFVQACGTPDSLDNLIDILYKGSPQSKVNSVVPEPCAPEKDFRGVFRLIGVD